MALLEKRFTAAESAAINTAVGTAESRTSAEIIPVIVGSSGRYDRSEDIVGLWLAVISFLFTAWLIRQESTPGSWSYLSPVAQLLICAGSIVAGFLVGAILGARIDWLRRLFTPSQQMQQEVQLRARAVFYDQRVHHTEGATGVMLYISLFERMATVLADRTLLEKIGQAEIDSLCQQLTAELKKQSPVGALEHSIRAAGERLAHVLPRGTDDRNELPDALVLLD